MALHPKFDLPRKTYEFIGRKELCYHDPKLFDKNFHPGLISLRSLELIRVYGKDYHNDKTRLVESEVSLAGATPCLVSYARCSFFLRS